MALEDVLEITEIFLSIQGEGRDLGRPTVFVRTWGCDRGCRWCDTPGARPPAAPARLSIRQILNRVRYLAGQCGGLDTVTLTGGEPTLQEHLPALCAALRAEGFRLALETNGDRFLDLPLDFVSLSPKLPSSLAPGAVAAPPPDPAVLRAWMNHCPWQLKFVFDTPADEDAIAALTAALAAPPAQVYLMPQGRDPTELRHRTPACLAVCLRRGWNFAPRLHIEIFGNTPGR